MKKNIFLMFLVLVFVGLIFFVLQEKQISFVQLKNNYFKSYQDEKNNEGSSSEAAKLINDESIILKKMSDQEFNQWIKLEASQLDRNIEDETATIVAIKDRAALLTIDQVTQLKNIILNSSLPINERIFSNFILANTYTRNANDTIMEIIDSTDAISKTKPLPHSEQELKRAQEYALRFALIDEASNRNQKDQDSALEFLIALSEKTNDPQIKLYALQKAKALSSKK